jgi:hypothetical protein
MTPWETQVARLAAYQAAHGNCNVPSGWAEDRALSKWVGNQRQYKRNLDRGEPSKGMTAERAAQLTSLGFVWDPGEAVWEAQLARLVVFKAAHGNCWVPQGWAEDLRLGRWVNTQRKGKKNLDRGDPSEGMTVERAARLTALGVAWDPDEAVWEAQLARLTSYKAAHGDCKVPWGWVEDPSLAIWVSTQRQGKKVNQKRLDLGEPSPGMTAERVAKLEALGFAWEGSHSRPDDTKWEAQLVRLAAFKAAHGDCNVPQAWGEDSEEPSLGRWVSRQRIQKNRMDRGEPSQGMTTERLAKLEALGFVWEGSSSPHKPASVLGASIKT